VAERARLHLIAHHKLVAQSIRHQAVARAHERPSCFCVGPELLLRPTSALSQLRPLLLASWAVCAVDFSTGPGIDSVSAALRTAAMFALAGFGSRGGSAALYALGRRLVSRQVAQRPQRSSFPWWDQSDFRPDRRGWIPALRAPPSRPRGTPPGGPRARARPPSRVVPGVAAGSECIRLGTVDADGSNGSALRAAMLGYCPLAPIWWPSGHQVVSPRLSGGLSTTTSNGHMHHRPTTEARDDD
jgi:hypothetical protein